MERESGPLLWVRALCEQLGRQRPWARCLDRLAAVLVPLPPLALAGAAAGNPGRAAPHRRVPNRHDLAAPMQMATGPHLNLTDHGKAPSVAHGAAAGSGAYEPDTWGAPWEMPWSDHAAHLRRKQDYRNKHTTAAATACADPKYKGMHGAPCKFHGGSDTQCPSGTTSGWFWSYDVPVIGRVYYVDCCGMKPAVKVWCNWTNESNWCVGFGRSANRKPPVDEYNCTLAILDADMKTRELSPGSNEFEVVGVDP